ncbi:acyltransferase family protein [Novosphingobium mangrovi (ex Huang et al. 2023)]|uniref:Acyltransferase n=1 Tax=Novosphingobium mangrovi (ex Huang et al. 2023) TaxID=2976432 RepID=A0ABT2I3E9_9SPHN|nr:acyltransferase [Novosphingobium mangrovi (ex Huang et al. 2023)]MCT2399329.1 acyltransferase [Novosphingobium mangrovi (ex Huang et al. 2023)]
MTADVAAAGAASARDSASGQSASQPRPSLYFAGLDVLRAVAVASVLYTHYFAERYWLLGVHWGGLGVQCFFVLSGFLITRIILGEHDRQEFRYGRFLLRRFARLYPCLLAFLLVALAATPGRDHGHFFWHAAYLSNVLFVLQGNWDGMYSHLWSLAVEQQFYLVWPAVILAVPRRFLPALLVAVILAAPAFRLIWLAAGMADFGVWVLPPAVLDSLGVGGLLAVAMRAGVRTGVIFGVFLATGLMFWFVPFSLVLGPVDVWPTAMSFLFGCLVVLALSLGRNERLVASPLVLPLIYVGQISYGIYMYHLMVQDLLGPLLQPRLGVFGALADRMVWAGVSFVLAALSYHVLEVPVRSWILRRAGEGLSPASVQRQRARPSLELIVARIRGQ